MSQDPESKHPKKPGESRSVEESSAAEPPCEHAKSEGAGNKRPREVGGREGPDPTRYGDWEKNGRCIDF